MVEAPRIPTIQQIAEAKSKYADRQYSDARATVRDVRRVNFSQLSRRHVSLQQQVLTAAQIDVRSSLSLAIGMETAVGVAAELAQAKDAIDKVYEHREVKVAAREIKTGINHEPYNFRAEMRRDKIIYTLMLVGLTGNTSLLGAAIKEMDDAIAEVQEPAEVMSLRFDRQRLSHRKDSTDESFAELTSVFEAAAQASLAAGNNKRAAEMAARYILDGQKYFGKKEPEPAQLVSARVVYDRAVRGREELADTLQKEGRKAFEEQRRYDRWRHSAPKGANYSSLALR